MSVATQITRLTNERNRFRNILLTYDLVSPTADLKTCIDALELFFEAVESSDGYRYEGKLLESDGFHIKTDDGYTLKGIGIISYK